MKPSLDEIAAHLGLSRQQIKALLAEGVIVPARMTLDRMKAAYTKHLALVRRGERPGVLDLSMKRDLDRILNRM